MYSSPCTYSYINTYFCFQNPFPSILSIPVMPLGLLNGKNVVAHSYEELPQVNMIAILIGYYVNLTIGSQKALFQKI